MTGYFKLYLPKQAGILGQKSMGKFRTLFNGGTLVPYLKAIKVGGVNPLKLSPKPLGLLWLVGTSNLSVHAMAIDYWVAHPTQIAG